MPNIAKRGPTCLCSSWIESRAMTLTMSITIGRSAKESAYSWAKAHQSFQERELQSHKSLHKRMFFLLNHCAQKQGRSATSVLHLPTPKKPSSQITSFSTARHLSTNQTSYLPPCWPDTFEKEKASYMKLWRVKIISCNLKAIFILPMCWSKSYWYPKRNNHEEDPCKQWATHLASKMLL